MLVHIEVEYSLTHYNKSPLFSAGPCDGNQQDAVNPDKLHRGAQQIRAHREEQNAHVLPEDSGIYQNCANCTGSEHNLSQYNI